MTKERLRQIIINDEDFNVYLKDLKDYYEVDLFHSNTSIAGTS